MTSALEEELEKTRREVEILKEEHKNFLYKISHDLNAPIRHIDGFSNLILAANFEQFDDETKKYFDIIVKSNRQLGAKLDALLKLSRLSTRQNSFQFIDTNAIFEHLVTNSLAGPIEASSAIVDVDNLPSVWGDLDHVTVLFEELLKNAVSFVSKNVAPHVHIKAEETESEVQIQMIDNGIGVAPKSRKTIFELFKRDVDRNAYPGQGVGLALAAKIIQLHNGKVWVEDNSPKGSVFCITLPKIAVS
ncbi:MAG: ATP-binding protein [Hyphomicrobiales bacterium]